MEWRTSRWNNPIRGQNALVNNRQTTLDQTFMTILRLWLFRREYRTRPVVHDFDCQRRPRAIKRSLQGRVLLNFHTTGLIEIDTYLYLRPQTGRLTKSL